MRRKSRYGDKVVAFAVAERKRGVKWKAIVEAIGRHFGIKPPTERQMRKWFQEFGVDDTDPEKLLRENLVKVARATTPIAAFATQKYLIEKVPMLVDALNQGKDVWIAGGAMVLSMLEQMVGSEKFNRIVEEYQKTRTGLVAPMMAENDVPSIKESKGRKRIR